MGLASKEWEGGERAALFIVRGEYSSAIFGIAMTLASTPSASWNKTEFLRYWSRFELIDTNEMTMR